MPVVVPRKPAPKPQEEAPKVAPAPAPAAPAGVTIEEVQTLLSRQAEEFRLQLASMAKEFARQIAASTRPQSSGWDFKVEYENNGDIGAIRATPRAKASAP